MDTDRKDRIAVGAAALISDALEAFVEAYAFMATAAEKRRREGVEVWHGDHPLADKHYMIGIRKRRQAEELLQRALSRRYFGAESQGAYSSVGANGPGAQEIREIGAVLVLAARSLPALVGVYTRPSGVISWPKASEIPPDVAARQELAYRQLSDPKPIAYHRIDVGPIGDGESFATHVTVHVPSDPVLDDTDSLADWRDDDEDPDADGVGRSFDPLAALEAATQDEEEIPW